MPDKQAAMTSARRWWITGSVLVGTCMGVLGNSMMPVALPAIQRHFDVRLNTGSWLISIYFLMVAVLMPVYGWFGDRYGYRRTYLFGLAGFVLFTFASAFSPNFGWLLAFRVCQGICNAATLPSVMGIISQVFPQNQRGKAIGVWGAVNGASHGLGPVISGILMEWFNWQALYIFDGLLALAGWLMIVVIVPSDRKAGDRSFDWMGACTFTLAILALMLGLSHTETLGTRAVVGLWAAFFVLTAAFVATEAGNRQPFIDLRLFSNRAYACLVAIAGGQFFCMVGYSILLPFYLIRLRGLSEVTAGPMVALLPGALALFSPVAGQIVDRAGLSKTLRTGMVVVTATSVTFLFLPGDAALWFIGGVFIIMGLGMGLIQSPAATGVTLIVASDQMGVALGIFNTLRFISVTLSATLCGVLLSPVRPGDVLRLADFHLGFLLLSTVSGAGLLMTFLMGTVKSK